MKSLSEMTGVERAAALLIAMGPDTAAEIMKHLDGGSIDKLSVAIASMERVPVQELEDLFGELLIDIKKSGKSYAGGEITARKILAQALGDERAEAVMKKISTRDLDRAFDFLNEVEEERLAALLQEEHGQTIAVVLSYLEPSKSALVMKKLDKDLAKDVALRMAKMSTVSPEAVLAIAEKLRQRIEEGSSASGARAGGIDSLVNILSRMSGSEEKKILEHFEVEMPELSRSIHNRMFVFENILLLTNTEVRVLIDEINEDAVIARALKGAGDQLKVKFFRNMSQNRATDCINEMNEMGAIRLSEVEDNRKRIVDIMRRLNDDGVISLRRDGEEYVE